jgi:phage terminase large subunit
MSRQTIPVSISKKIFNDVYIPYLTNYARTQIFFGGSASGKSVFLSERAVFDILAGGRNYLVCRAVGKTIKRSVFTEIKKVITAWDMWDEFEKNETDLTITCANGYQILFAGLDDTEKLKSITPAKGVLTDVWVEEATEVDRGSVKDLYKRQRGGRESTRKRLTMSFNPILQNHWIFEEYFKSIGWGDDQEEYNADDLTILKTTYKDNRFLTTQDRADLENEKDQYRYDVYTLGKWGVLGNVIFTNWRIADLSGMRDQFTNRRNGLDFGFASNPAAIGVSHYDYTRKTIYFYDEFYETGYTNDMLADEAKRMIGFWKEQDGKQVCTGTEDIICDSAEPKSIKELQNYGVNARGAKKGKDSVNFGIQWLQQQTIVVDKKCINMQNELRQYKWKEGADGKPVSPPKPVDANNHLIDGGLRYAYEDDMESEQVTTEPNPFYD